MNLKKIKVVAVLGIFILSFLSHFAYDLFPNIIFSFIFPVNESIWEHMKLLSTTILLYGIIEYFLLKIFENFIMNKEIKLLSKTYILVSFSLQFKVSDIKYFK